MSSHSGFPTRILVVEDSCTQAERISRSLKAEGFDVVVAHDGREGLGIFLESHFDLVLSDVWMPQMDGYELCRRIKASPEGAGVPVILLTVLGKPQDIIRGLESGANAYINKPYEDSYLLGRIRDTLQNQKLRQGRGSEGAIDIVFAGQSLTINSPKPQILDFLAAAFEDFIRASQREHQAHTALMQEKHHRERETHRIREELLLEQSRKLRQAGDFLQATLDALAARIAILDATGKIVAVNAAWKDQPGGHPLIGAHCIEHKSYLETCHEAARNGVQHATLIADDVQAVLAGRRSGTYLEYGCHIDGEERWFGIHISLFHEADPAHVVVAHEDITQRKLTEEQLYRLAFHDPLTGLSNRARFEDHLSQAIQRVQEHPACHFAVLFLDLDGFKLINDSLGHAVGDQLLVAIARRLEKCLRHGDKVARLGGDEFVILIEDVRDVADVTRLAESVGGTLRHAFWIEGRQIFITASIGIALHPSGLIEGARSVLRDADMAMYHAKRTGRGRHAIFDPSMHDQAIARLNLESELRSSIEHEEFRVHYQPIISLATGAVAGFEALVRWDHPTRGLVDPAEFVPIAEETGLILPLGTLVLRESCRWLRSWQEQRSGLSRLTLSVNLSGRQLEQPDFAEQVDQILQETGLDASGLRLEVTESVAMRDAERVALTLHRLRKLGIRVSLDDFGTGYSSLNYLQRLPIDILKIDRSFVTPIHGEGRDSDIVRTILVLAQQLRMDVVAEGVETVVQYQWLRDVGCRFGQGFYFSRALDGDSALSLLETSPVSFAMTDTTQPVRLVRGSAVLPPHLAQCTLDPAFSPILHGGAKRKLV
ncbi:MAG: GGDEF/EAL domain-containing response regulator [Isosphaeraceae bacterium]